MLRPLTLIDRIFKVANSHSGNTSSSELISSVCWLVGWYQIKFIRHYRTSNLADGSSYLTVKAVIKDASRKTILALSSIHHISGDQMSQESQCHLITTSGADLTYR